MFAALHTTLEEIAITSVNGPSVETLYTTLPRNIFDSGASMTFTRESTNVTNARKHVRPNDS